MRLFRTVNSSEVFMTTQTQVDVQQKSSFKHLQEMTLNSNLN